jgi:hypothetical protein
MKPQITFFKASYRRHTMFAMEAIEQAFTGNPDFGRKVQVTISRNADLIGRAYLAVTLPAVTAATGSGFSWVSEVGHQLISSVEFDIGGQQIDQHYGDWLSIWASLTLPAGQAVGYANMIGNVSTLTGTVSASGAGHAAAAGVTLPATQLYVPLAFSWNRHSGLYIPLIALQYHEVKINIEFAAFSALHRGAATATPALGDCSLWIDYVYLDTEERRKFAQFPHEYLIEQLQYNGAESLVGLNNKVKLTFNHPVKELYWFVRRSDVVDGSSAATRQFQDPTNYTTVATSDAGVNPVASAKLRLNGQDRFAVRDGAYFRYVQHFQHHTNTGAEGLCTYSFALLPEEHQPSGTVNMSRIDNATLDLTLVPAMSGVSAAVSVFALNYNILRIASGMGGLAFAS